jgi:hypothetical protein
MLVAEKSLFQSSNSMHNRVHAPSLGLALAYLFPLKTEAKWLTLLLLLRPRINPPCSLHLNLHRLNSQSSNDARRGCVRPCSPRS